MTQKEGSCISKDWETPIDAKRIEDIIARSEPVEDQEDLRSFLTNVCLFLKRVDGVDLTEEEKMYPSHSQFSHLTFRKDRSTAEGLKYRLQIIDRYQITNAQQIINIIASTAVSTPEGRLTPRQTHLIKELHKSPELTQYELAERLSTTPQVIRTELTQLRQSFSLAVVYNLDFGKFRLALYEIDFQTRSLDASEEMERNFRRNPPVFLRRINFDHNYRDGFLHFSIPDQPSGREMLTQRINWLNSNFLEKSTYFRMQSFRIDISFENYDIATGNWMLNSDSFSVGMLRFISNTDHEHLPPRKHVYSEPIRFDRIDYILASTPYVFGEKQHTEICQKVLERHGYSISKKTIWNRQKKLMQAGAYYPSVWYDTPELEELVKFSIECSSKALEPIYRLISILPYTFSVETDTGLTFSFHRPSRCSSITGLLAQAFEQIDGVSDVSIFRYEPTFSPQLFTQTADRWDESRQRWLPRKGDI
ncbi:MAG: hypothetical protein ACFE9D_04425 [Promethearchaeota archaeon]